MEILNFINFKFEDLHKAKKLGFGVLSYSRASVAEQRRQSRRSSRHRSLLLRRKISINMEPITPERDINTNKEKSVAINSNSEKDVFIKPKMKLNKKIESKDESKKNDRRELLKQWKLNREKKLKEEKQRQKPIFRVGGPSNIGFPVVKESEEKMNYSFAPKKHEFKAPINIKPLPMKLPPLKKEEKQVEKKANNLNTKNNIFSKINTRSNLTSKINKIKTNTTSDSNTSMKIVNNNKVLSNKSDSLKSINTSLKTATKSMNINTKATKLDAVNIINSNDTLLKSKNLNTNSKTALSSNRNRFIRVTRSQKVISSPVKSKLTLPSKKVNNKTNVKTNRKIPKVINLEEEKSKVQFQDNIKDEKVHIKYQKTPIVPSKNVDNDTDQIHEDIDVNDTEIENKTPKLRKSLRIKKITESEKYEPVCIVCKFSCSDKSHHQKKTDDASKSNKRKTIDTGCVDSDSNYKASTKKTRRSDYKNKLQDDNNDCIELIEENVKTPKRRTRNQSVKNIDDKNKKNISESTTKSKKNTRKSICNNDIKENTNDLNIETEKENIQNKIRTPRNRRKSNILTENNDNKKEDTDKKSKNKTPSEKKKPNTTIKTPEVNSTETSSCDVFVTPDNSRNNSMTSVYISPFVTTSRGKGSTKKENKARQMLGINPYSSQKNTEEAGTKYYHTILDNVIERLKIECSTWEKYKESENITEDAKDLIDVAIGQTNLLINKKFQQFRNLIYNCENGDGECPVTCEDLQGFWDMVYMQVTNLDTRYKRLVDLKNNNWEEIWVPIKKNVQPKRTKSVPQPKAKSNIREAIRAARLKSKTFLNVSKNNETVFDGGFFVVKSPNKNITEKKTPNKKTPAKRKSLLTSVLSAEAKKTGRVTCSPGLTTLNLSHALKSVGRNKNDLNQTLPTPGKSILKKNDHLKPHNISKVVLFKDEESEGENTE